MCEHFEFVSPGQCSRHCLFSYLLWYSRVFEAPSFAVLEESQLPFCCCVCADCDNYRHFPCFLPVNTLWWESLWPLGCFCVGLFWMPTKADVPLVMLQCADKCQTMDKEAAFRLLNQPNSNKTDNVYGILSCHVGMKIRFLAKLNAEKNLVQDILITIIDFEFHAEDRRAYQETFYPRFLRVAAEGFSGCADWEELFSLCRAHERWFCRWEACSKLLVLTSHGDTGLVLICSHWSMMFVALAFKWLQFSDKHNTTGTDAAEGHYFGLCPRSRAKWWELAATFVCDVFQSDVFGEPFTAAATTTGNARARSTWGHRWEVEGIPAACAALSRWRFALTSKQIDRQEDINVVLITSDAIFLFWIAAYRDWSIHFSFFGGSTKKYLFVSRSLRLWEAAPARPYFLFWIDGWVATKEDTRQFALRNCEKWQRLFWSHACADVTYVAILYVFFWKTTRLIEWWANDTNRLFSKPLKPQCDLIRYISLTGASKWLEFQWK